MNAMRKNATRSELIAVMFCLPARRLLRHRPLLLQYSPHCGHKRYLHLTRSPTTEQKAHAIPVVRLTIPWVRTGASS
jgi:hypothetical protein